MEASVNQLVQDFAAYKSAVDGAFSAVDTAIINLQAAVAAAKQDPAKLAELDAEVNAAAQAVAAEKQKVQAADPGPVTPPTPGP